ncbi:hypothetical protein [Shewanella polaris]|uniref:Uncharacterized protein n=1 Tax=Shewanella polaris TaxID=2588449 RepID=A0A4Y5YII1_9GAMM|nr:hypothetical protein [Shewanella polaris]QDE32395.1 hypothetical protein FH971_16345 [Shewanella polaris]
MESLLRNTFNNMIQEYEVIFESYYPSHHSTGFMEANQVHLFAKSLCNLQSDAFSWFEAPLKKVGRSYPRIDAVIFIPGLEAVVFIEAKRINNPNAKVNEIYKDIDRLLIDNNRNHIMAKVKFDIKHQYIVYLADVWLETKNKKSIPYWWCSKEKPDGILDRVSSRYKDTQTFVERMQSVGVNWNIKNQHIHEFRMVENYCLMFGIHKI